MKKLFLPLLCFSMAAFATVQVCHGPLLGPPPPPDAPLKTAYGHGFATNYADSYDAITTLCSVPGVTVVNWRPQWSITNPSSGVYNWTTIDTAILAAQASSNPGCKIFWFPEVKSFSNGSPTSFAGEKNPNPEDLRDSSCTPGVTAGCNIGLGSYPNTDTKTAHGAVTAATNPAPGTAITVTAAAHGFANGDAVVIRGSTSEIAVNGDFCAEAVTTNTFDLYKHDCTTKISGSGAFTNNGSTYWYKNAVMTAKLYDKEVTDRFNLMVADFATHTFQSFTMDEHPNIIGMIFQETANGLNGFYVPPDYSDTRLTDGTPATIAAGGLTGAQRYRDGLIKIYQFAAMHFNQNRLLAFINFIQGGNGFIKNDILPAMDPTTHPPGALRTALENNKWVISGPDLLPDNSSLWLAGTSVYQAIIGWGAGRADHAGGRSNSAQNTSEELTNFDFEHLFQFATQGIWGAFPQPADGSGTTQCLGALVTPGKCVDPLNRSPRTAGLCINTWILWNHDTNKLAGVERWRQAIPVIAAHPYGPDWYGRCTGGGLIP